MPDRPWRDRRVRTLHRARSSSLFFARYEASQLGSLSIESEHLLLGVIRLQEDAGRDPGVAVRVLGVSRSEAIRKDIEGRTVFREKVPTSVEIPFSAEVRRTLSFAAAEADGVLDNHIGPEHLLLGLLQEKGSLAAETLARHGLGLEAARQQIAAHAQEPASGRAQLQGRVDHIALLAQRLQQLLPGDSEAFKRVDGLLEDLRVLKALLERGQ